MIVQFILFIVLFILMGTIGGKKGLKSFFTLCINFLVLLFMLIFIALRADPIKSTIIISIIICSMTLFFINGVNKKTLSSLLSVVIVVLITLIITYRIGISAKIYGFGGEQAEALSSLSVYVNINFSKIVICEILIGLLGAIIDVSISISSSMNEIYQNNSSIKKEVLLKSGMNIGQDILSTMANTLLFALIGGLMTFIVWYSQQHYTLANYMNGKILCGEIFQLLCSGIGIILIIPVTAFITSIILFISFPEDKGI